MLFFLDNIIQFFSELFFTCETSMAMKNLQSSFVQKCCFLETDLIARLEFFDYERILHRSKRKKNTRKWQLFYINHLFSHPKKGVGGQGWVYLGKRNSGQKNL